MNRRVSLLVTIILLVVTPGFVIALMQLPNVLPELADTAHEGNWLGFWGSYLSALISSVIAGLVAVYVSRNQLIKSRRDDEERFLRSEHVKIVQQHVDELDMILAEHEKSVNTLTTYFLDNIHKINGGNEDIYRTFSSELQSKLLAFSSESYFTIKLLKRFDFFFSTLGYVVSESIGNDIADNVIGTTAKTRVALEGLLKETQMSRADIAGRVSALEAEIRDNYLSNLNILNQIRKIYLGGFYTYYNDQV